MARQTTLPLLGVVFASVFFAPHSGFATDKFWTGATSTGWGTNSNWTGNAPAAGDNAVFNATFLSLNQPALTGNTSAGGIWMTGAITSSVTIGGGANILTLGGNTINGTAGLGILIDNTTAFTLTISCVVKLGNAQTWTNSSSNLLTVSGNVNTNTKALTVNGTGNTAISGVISSSGALTKSGTGTLTLSGTNTYTGITTVTGGILSINLLANGSSNSSLGAVTNAATNLVLNGGTLQYTGATVSTDRLFSVGTSGATINASGTGALSLTNTGALGFNGQTGARTLTLTGTNTGNNTLAAAIGDNSGATSLVKSGTGTWVLTGSNTFSGTTSINAGTLNVGSSGALGSSGTISFGGGTLQYSASNTTDYSGRFSTASNQAYSIDTNNQTVTFANALTSSGGSLTKLGAGTLILSGANTYTGGTTLSAGTLKLSGSGTLGSTSGSLAVNGGTLDLNGTNQTVGALSGTSGTILNNATATAKTLTVGNGGASGSYAGVIADHTSGTGTLALTKTGTGTQTLTGANTFTGTTTINGGTLTLANGSGSALGSTSAITVNSGGTLLLGASNQINNSAGITLNAGTFSMGGFTEGDSSHVGLGALTLTASNSHLDFGTGAPGLVTFTSFTANSLTLIIDNWTGTAGVVGNAGTDRLIFGADESSNLNYFSFTGFSGATEIALGGGFYEIVPVTAVPEPTTYLSGALAITSFIWHLRHRRRDGIH